LSQLLRLSAALALATALASSAASAAASEVSVTLADGVVTPKVLEVPADTAVTLLVTNTGKTSAEFESKRLHVESIVAPGQTAAIELRPLPAGNYAFVEEFHEDLETARGEIVAK